MTCARPSGAAPAAGLTLTPQQRESGTAAETRPSCSHQTCATGSRKATSPGSSSTSSTSSTFSPSIASIATTGTAIPPYDPKLLLGVLPYAYCIGVRSSRQIEQAGAAAAGKAVTTLEQVIVAAELTQDANDVHQLDPMLHVTAATLAAAGIEERPRALLADSGYWSIDNLATIQGAPELYIPPARHGRQGKPRKDGKLSASRSDGLRAAMKAKLKAVDQPPDPVARDSRAPGTISDMAARPLSNALSI